LGWEAGRYNIPLNNLAVPSSFWRGVEQEEGEKPGVCFQSIDVSADAPILTQNG
jgi:hypothetical protein